MTWGSLGTRVLTHPHVASFCRLWVWCPVHRFFKVSIFREWNSSMFSIPKLRRKLVELRGTWTPFGIELMVYGDPLSSSHVFLNLNNPCLNIFFEFKQHVDGKCWPFVLFTVFKTNLSDLLNQTDQTDGMQYAADCETQKQNKQSINQTNKQYCGAIR